jgi:hypothetical protein
VLGALPGIREIRSSLASGYLWIFFLWLVFDPMLGESNFDSEPYRSAHHLGNDIGPVALGVTVTFAAYLIGTFFNEFRGFIARLYLRARQTASSSISVQERTEALQEARARGAITRERLIERWKGLFDFNQFFDLPPARSAGRPLFVERAEILLRRIAYAMAAVLSAPLLLFSLSLSVAAKTTEWTEVLIFTLIRWVISIRVEPYKPFVTTNGVTAIERYLQREEGSFPEGVKPGVADVIADFPVIRTRLIHRSPDTVSEYDRLRAEADFRSAIVPPLFAILCVFAIKLSPLWGLGVPFLLILVATARTKRREAGDILADTLGVVDAPAIEPRPSPASGSSAEIGPEGSVA